MATLVEPATPRRPRGAAFKRGEKIVGSSVELIEMRPRHKIVSQARTPSAVRRARSATPESQGRRCPSCSLPALAFRDGAWRCARCGWTDRRRPASRPPGPIFDHAAGEPPMGNDPS